MMSVDLVTDEGLNVLLQHHHEQLPPETLALIESLSHELRAAVRSDPHIWLKASENRMADCSRAATCKLLHRTVRSLGPTLSEAARTRCLSLFGGTLGFGESGQALFEGGLDLMRAADTPELVKLLDGRRAMLKRSGGLIEAAKRKIVSAPSGSSWPLLVPDGMERLSFILDVHTLPSSAPPDALFERRLSMCMLWMHNGGRLEVDNDEYEDWLMSGGGSGGSDDEYDEYDASDETMYDDLAACNFGTGPLSAGRPTLGLLVRRDETLLLEIKLVGQLNDDDDGAGDNGDDDNDDDDNDDDDDADADADDDADEADDDDDDDAEDGQPIGWTRATPPKNPGVLDNALFFSSIVSGQTLYELYEAGDCYNGRGRVAAAPQGGRNVKLYDYWAQNVRKRNLSRLPSHLEEAWGSLPGLKHTFLLAGLRKTEDGQLFLEDVHFSFPSGSGMSKGVFDINPREFWLHAVHSHPVKVP